MTNSEPKWIATDCTICYHSCGMNVLVEKGKIVRVEGLKEHPLNKGQLCPKGQRAIEFVYHPDRLKYPLKKVKKEWKRIPVIPEVSVDSNDRGQGSPFHSHPASQHQGPQREESGPLRGDQPGHSQSIWDQRRGCHPGRIESREDQGGGPCDRRYGRRCGQHPPWMARGGEC